MPWIGIVTNNGSRLLEEWTDGKTLHITSAKTAPGTVDAVALFAQTDLAGAKNDASIVQQKRVAGGIQLKIQVTSAQTAYTLHQIGIWAGIGTGQPVLLALFQHDVGQYVPSKTESADFAYSFYAVLAVSNVGEFSVQIDASALVTQGTMQEAVSTAVTAVQTDLTALLQQTCGSILRMLMLREVYLPVANQQGKPLCTRSGTVIAAVRKN